MVLRNNKNRDIHVSMATRPPLYIQLVGKDFHRLIFFSRWRLLTESKEIQSVATSLVMALFAMASMIAMIPNYSKFKHADVTT
mmetsp:Transcript_12514/g.24409  ORF Transcript_12514/g.24409 Transcript_12514/m.24409 type:complete len:83 (+) Transcript_12514:2-250(+)